MTRALPLAVTMGEPAGIGGELTLKAWLARRGGGRPFFTIDCPFRLTELAHQLGLGCRRPHHRGTCRGVGGLCHGAACPAGGVGRTDRSWTPNGRNAAATVAAIAAATQMALSGRSAAW